MQVLTRDQVVAFYEKRRPYISLESRQLLLSPAVADAAQAIEQVNHIIEEISSIASTVAITVEEQNRAVAEIAEGVQRASSEAQGGAEAMGRVAGASKDARSAAADVKSLADTDRKSTRLNSSHRSLSRMPSSA